MNTPHCVSFRDIQDVRVVLEVGTATLAAPKRTQQDMDRHGQRVLPVQRRWLDAAGRGPTSGRLSRAATSGRGYRISIRARWCAATGATQRLHHLDNETDLTHTVEVGPTRSGANPQSMLRRANALARQVGLDGCQVKSIETDVVDAPAVLA